MIDRMEQVPDWIYARTKATPLEKMAGRVNTGCLCVSKTMSKKVMGMFFCRFVIAKNGCDFCESLQ